MSSDSVQYFAALTMLFALTCTLLVLVPVMSCQALAEEAERVRIANVDLEATAAAAKVCH